MCHYESGEVDMQGVIEALVCTAVKRVYKCFHTTPFKCFVYRLVVWEHQWKILLLEKRNLSHLNHLNPFLHLLRK